MHRFFHRVLKSCAVPDKGRLFSGKGKTSFHGKRGRNIGFFLSLLSAAALRKGGSPFKEKQDIFNALTVEELNTYFLEVFDTAEVIVNYLGAQRLEQIYTQDQIEALFLLNRFSQEQLEDLGYDIPDMGCPGEYRTFDKSDLYGTQTKQLLLEHFQDKKSKKKQKKTAQSKKVIFEELPKEKRDAIKAYFKDCGLDLDAVANEYLKAEKRAEEESEK